MKNILILTFGPTNNSFPYCIVKILISQLQDNLCQSHVYLENFFVCIKISVKLY